MAAKYVMVWELDEPEGVYAVYAMDRNEEPNPLVFCRYFTGEGPEEVAKLALAGEPEDVDLGDLARPWGADSAVDVFVGGSNGADGVWLRRAHEAEVAYLKELWRWR